MTERRPYRRRQPAMRRVYLCSHCSRIVDTEIVIGSPIGNIIVPAAHQNDDGETCDGDNAEVVKGWA